MAEVSLPDRARAGQFVPGTMIFECYSPGVARLSQLAGAEFVMFDMEHTGQGLESLRGLVATCAGTGIAPMIRVPRGEYHFLARALDIGCHGVMIPMVESAAQADAIVEATRYPPKGRRGAAFGFANNEYVSEPVADTMRRLDARTCVIAQIETERGVEHVEEIAAIDGIDVLWVGHFDLTNFLGIPAQFDDARYIVALERVVAAARRHGKGLGIMPTDPAMTRRYRAMGFNMMAAGTEPAILQAGWRAILEPGHTTQR